MPVTMPATVMLEFVLCTITVPPFTSPAMVTAFVVLMATVHLAAVHVIEPYKCSAQSVGNKFKSTLEQKKTIVKFLWILPMRSLSGPHCLR